MTQPWHTWVSWCIQISKQHHDWQNSTMTFTKILRDIKVYVMGLSDRVSSSYIIKYVNKSVLPRWWLFRLHHTPDSRAWCFVAVPRDCTQPPGNETWERKSLSEHESSRASILSIGELWTISSRYMASSPTSSKAWSSDILMPFSQVSQLFAAARWGLQAMCSVSTLQP